MRAAWAVLGGLVLGGVLAWWVGRDQARERSPEAPRRAADSAAAQAADAVPALYRWRDADGTLQITDAPPKGVPYERIAREPVPGIRVDAGR